MQRKWVAAMDSMYKKSGRCSSFIENQIPVKNIGSPPIMLNLTTIKRKSTTGTTKKNTMKQSKPVAKKRTIAPRDAKTAAARPAKVPTTPERRFNPNPLDMALELEKERQKSTQRELELTKQHHERRF